jgi:hypothetical protein
VLNYIYGLYFKPYRTDIEYDQFLAKVLRLDYATPPDDSSAARSGFVLHRAICARVDRALLGTDIQDASTIRSVHCFTFVCRHTAKRLPEL